MKKREIIVVTNMDNPDTDAALLKYPEPQGLPLTLEEFRVRLNGKLQFSPEKYQPSVKKLSCGFKTRVSLFTIESNQEDPENASLSIRYTQPHPPHFPGSYTITRRLTAENAQVIFVTVDFPFSDNANPASTIDTGKILKYQISVRSRRRDGSLDDDTGKMLEIKFDPNQTIDAVIYHDLTKSGKESHTVDPTVIQNEFGISLNDLAIHRVDPETIATHMLMLPEVEESIVLPASDLFLFLK